MGISCSGQHTDVSENIHYTRGTYSIYSRPPIIIIMIIVSDPAAAEEEENILHAYLFKWSLLLFCVARTLAVTH